MGFQVVDGIASRFNIKLKKVFFHPYQIGKAEVNNQQLYLVKPLTYMNRSGAILGHLLKRVKGVVDELVIVCDNLDLPPGGCRLKLKGSSGGQRGLASVTEALGSSQFKRLFIGVGRPSSGISVIDHVLGNPSGEERSLVLQSVQAAIDGLLLLLESPPDQVMGKINKRK